MSTTEQNSWRIIEHPDFSIEISAHAGFCFGVVNAIKKAETALKDSNKIYSIGNIVHNSEEVQRMADKGLQTIAIELVEQYQHNTILFRAHGEPPESYEKLKNHNIELIDATCPVVLKIQQRIKKAWEASKNNQSQVVIFGKKNHPEVIGLMGQTEYQATLISSIDEIDELDFTKPIELFAQTTMPINDYQKLGAIIKSKSNSSFIQHQTICRQVADRETQLSDFSASKQVILFVGDQKSSNSKVLFNACKRANNNSHFITNDHDINIDWLINSQLVGICGATSTPLWLMQRVALRVEQYKLTQGLK